MQRSQITFPLSVVILVFSLAQAAAETLCKPVMTFKEVRFSEVHSQQRVWSAVLQVDASACASASGRFNINFIRLKEMAPDLLFAEQFTWRRGQVEISVKLWEDEAVHDYSIGYISLCDCRS